MCDADVQILVDCLNALGVPVESSADKHRLLQELVSLGQRARGPADDEALACSTPLAQQQAGPGPVSDPWAQQAAALERECGHARLQLLQARRRAAALAHLDPVDLVERINESA